MKDKNYAAGVDIGGTWVRVALFNETKKTLEKIKEPIDVNNELSVSTQVTKLIRMLCKRYNVDLNSINGIGIASAGPLDTKKGNLIKPANIPFETVPLIEPIQTSLELPVVLNNDCTAAVLGEKMFGRGKEANNLFYVSLSTGIGGGAIVDNHLLLGKDGNAAEIGHFVIDYEGKLTCGCGKRGHWEAYCSGKNIKNFVKIKIEELKDAKYETSLLCKNLRESEEITSELLFNAAKSRDKLAINLIEELGNLNAIGFANIINAYDPSIITVGGAIALNNAEFVLLPIKKNVSKYAVNRIPEIHLTSLGDEIGLLGGIAMILRQKEHLEN